MNDKEGLNLLDFLATGINREDPAIKAVLSDENGEGAVANEAEALAGFIGYYTRTDDVRNHKGHTLEMLAKQFAKLRRRVGENDSVLLRRLLALTGRKGDVIWGNALNMKHVFETYFRDISCYVAENTSGVNLLNNGDFEQEDSWALGGGASYANGARFSGKRGLFFDGESGETCVQLFDRLLVAGVYVFHFFLNGKCGLVIENGEGKCWNANDQAFSGGAVLEWVEGEVINIFEKPDGWDDAFCFIKMPEDGRNIIFRFVSLPGETACIDYARLYKKPHNSSYTLIFHYEGYAVMDKSLHLGAGVKDPEQGVNYDNESYFDSAFIVGLTGVSQSQAFKDVLSLVKPCGIQVFTEFVEKYIVERGDDQ